MLRKCYLNSLAFSWQFFLIISKLFFKKWRESEDFFVLGYLFINFTIDILNVMVDLPCLQNRNLVLIFQIFDLVGRHKILHLLLLIVSYFLHLINVFYCLLWTFNILHCVFDILINYFIDHYLLFHVFHYFFFGLFYFLSGFSVPIFVTWKKM